eukprot:TRINITY_DN67784_c3_g10_i1.p1 TRINITY_DN67784_c3_g10~~TRINITY_DN67784_c3_g10_i1.p1  ORF type:complete len:707 (+),score=66.92 TRINITY_DN67784_c3_g10_i1:72-2192(+)
MTTKDKQDLHSFLEERKQQRRKDYEEQLANLKAEFTSKAKAALEEDNRAWLSKEPSEFERLQGVSELLPVNVTAKDLLEHEVNTLDSTPSDELCEGLTDAEHLTEDHFNQLRRWKARITAANAHRHLQGKPLLRWYELLPALRRLAEEAVSSIEMRKAYLQQQRDNWNADLKSAGKKLKEDNIVKEAEERKKDQQEWELSHSPRGHSTVLSAPYDSASSYSAMEQTCSASTSSNWLNNPAEVSNIIKGQDDLLASFFATVNKQGSVRDNGTDSARRHTRKHKQLSRMHAPALPSPSNAGRKSFAPDAPPPPLGYGNSGANESFASEVDEELYRVESELHQLRQGSNSQAASGTLPPLDTKQGGSGSGNSWEVGGLRTATPDKKKLPTINNSKLTKLTQNIDAATRNPAGPRPDLRWGSMDRKPRIQPVTQHQPTSNLSSTNLSYSNNSLQGGTYERSRGTLPHLQKKRSRLRHAQEQSEEISPRTFNKYKAILNFPPEAQLTVPERELILRVAQKDKRSKEISEAAKVGAMAIQNVFGGGGGLLQQSFNSSSNAALPDPSSTPKSNLLPSLGRQDSGNTVPSLHMQKPPPPILMTNPHPRGRNKIAPIVPSAGTQSPTSNGKAVRRVLPPSLRQQQQEQRQPHEVPLVPPSGPPPGMTPMQLLAAQTSSPDQPHPLANTSNTATEAQWPVMRGLPAMLAQGRVAVR